MKCHYCGCEVIEKDIFCRHCGTRQQAAPVQEPVPVVAEQVTVEAAPVHTAPETVPAPRSAPVYEEKTFGWQPYGAPAPEEPLFVFEKSTMNAPKLQLPTKRGLGKMIFLSILTFGIYPMVIWSRLVGEVNLVASRYDGERSMSFFGMLMLAPLTLGIHSLVWFHKLCRRIGMELQRRRIDYDFGARDFWLLNFLLAFIGEVCFVVSGVLYGVGHQFSFIWILLAAGLLTMVGPFIFIHKLMRSMNKLNEHFNING